MHRARSTIHHCIQTYSLCSPVVYKHTALGKPSTACANFETRCVFQTELHAYVNILSSHIPQALMARASDDGRRRAIDDSNFQFQISLFNLNTPVMETMPMASCDQEPRPIHEHNFKLKRPSVPGRSDRTCLTNQEPRTKLASCWRALLARILASCDTRSSCTTQCDNLNIIRIFRTSDVAASHV